MPHGGRPPGVAGGRSRKEWERQTREWEEQNRFQEVDSDDSVEDVVDLDDIPFTSDRLRFTGYDLAQGMQGRRAPMEDSPTYSEHYEDDEDAVEYEQRSREWQIEMKAKEDELVARAERRMHRARLRGESNVQLTREELDALERKRLREENKIIVRPPNPSSSKAITITGSKKRSGGFFGMGSSSAASVSKSRKSPSKKASPRSSGVATPDGTRADLFDPRTGYYLPPATHASDSPAKRNSRPVSSASMRQPGTPPSGHYEPQSRHVSAPDSRPRSSRASPIRSFPDEPDWHPRSRPSSSSQLYNEDPLAYQVGQSSHIPGRRIVSSPAGVSYSTQRRVAPPASRSSGPGSSEITLLNRSNSGLGNDIVEISSDEEESDDGVRVDYVPEASSSGQGNNSLRGGAISGPRTRKGRR